MPDNTAHGMTGAERAARHDRMAAHAAAAEVRIVDSNTGGAKGSKVQRYDLIPPAALAALAEHYGRGEAKYPSDPEGAVGANWRRGYRWGLSYAALMRHLEAWRAGESVDPETGSHHLTAVAWHAFALFTFESEGLGSDDRAL